MGKGFYSGGHTKISLSAEGTAWPTAADDPGVAASESRRQPAQRRWSGKPSDDPPSRMTHTQELEHVILCARAFRQDQLSERFPQPPETLAEFIAGLGGNISWLQASPKRKQRFIDAMRKSKKREWIVTPPPTASAKGKSVKTPKRTKAPKRVIHDDVRR